MRKRKSLLILIVVMLVIVSSIFIMTACETGGQGPTPNPGEDGSVKPGDGGETNPPVNPDEGGGDTSVHKHVYGEWELVTLPTETTEGSIKRSCDCGTEEIVRLPIVSEKNYTITILSESTCTAHGKKKLSFSSNDISFEFEIETPKLAHDWEYTYSNTTHHKVCKVCKIESQDEAHSFGEWVTVQDATCQAVGSKYRDCECGYREIAEIAIKDHDYDQDTHRCKYCNLLDETYYNPGMKFQDNGDGTYSVLEYRGTAAELYIPNVYNGGKVTQILKGSIFNNYKGYDVYIPSNVEIICDEAMRTNGNKINKLIVAPNSKLHTIGNKSFYAKYCKLPPSLKKLGSARFGYLDISDIEAWMNIDNGPNAARPAVSGNLFLNGERVVDLIIPEGITEIKDNAFRDSTFNSIKLPSTLKKIGKSAFDGSKIRNIEIPDGVTHIGDYAFRSSHLATVYLPKSVQYVGTSAFENSSGGIIVYAEASNRPAQWQPQNITVWNANINKKDEKGYEYYFDEQGLKYRIKDGVVAFGDQNTYISGEVIVPAYINYNGKKVRVSRIDGGSGFQYGHIRSIYIERNGVDTISQGAFYSSSIDYLYIPDTVKNVGRGILSGSYAHVYVEAPSKPSGWSNVWNDVHFGDITWAANDMPQRYVTENSIVYSITGSDTASIIQQDATLNVDVVTIPSQITFNNRMYNVTELENKAFFGQKLVTQFILPDTLVKIGNNAFNDCRLLSAINIPDSVTSIGDNAFDNCFSLKNISLSKALVSIGNNAFDGCTELASVTLPDSLESIGSHAFSGCKKLTNISLPSNLVSIGSHAFYLCQSIKNISIPNGVTSIGESTFNSCEALESITLNEGLITIGKYAFNTCMKLQSITIPSSVTSIDETAFYFTHGIDSIVVKDGNAKFTSKDKLGNEHNCIIDKATNALVLGCNTTTIPDEITGIGAYAFACKAGLTEIAIPRSVQYIGRNAFENCKGLVSINVPEGITIINEYAFRGCTSLVDVTLPDSLVTIGRGAFDTCLKIKNINIPSGVTMLDEYAFYACKELECIIIPNKTINIGKWVFSGCDMLTIYAEATSKPVGWIENWNNNNRPVYWYSEIEPTGVPATGNGYWHYDTDGVTPVIWKKTV